MQPAVDVLIPVFNASSTVRAAVDSIRGQSVENIIIHIVDDGSTDGTSAVLAKLASEDSRITIHSKANGGIVEALNFGLQFCNSPYIARHDADDLAYPNRFRMQLDYLEHHLDCVAVGSAVRHIDGDGKRLMDYVSVSVPSDCDPNSYPSREPYIIHPFLMVRREAILQVGGYRQACNCEDTDLYWRLQSVGRLHNLDECLGEYRLHDTSISGSSLKNGRLMAVFSQIAAISEQRRRNNVPDISFDKRLADAAKNCGSLAEIVELCVSTLGLDQRERSYLSLAAGAKLLELTSYRPYDIELADSRFIRDALRTSNDLLNADGRSSIAGQLTASAASLAMKARFSTALALLSPENYPAFTYRLGLRLAVPVTLRRKLRSLMFATSAPER